MTFKEGQVAKFVSEFPSILNEKGDARGAVVLFRINEGATPVQATIQWENTIGIPNSFAQTVDFPSNPPPVFLEFLITSYSL